MADYFQNGVITTLHNLSDRPVDELENDLLSFTKQGSPMALILPSLYSELEGPALKKIVNQLKEVKYVKQIIIGLDRANSEEQFKHAKEFFSVLPQDVNILWNDGPKMKEIQKLLSAENLAPTEPGKGSNVWVCMGYFLASDIAKTVALHDCDILTYDRGLLARLFYPIAHPVFGFKFAKGFYYRATDSKLNGRVTRLLVSPLVRSLRTVTNDSKFLDYIDSFRYPLAGEFCMFHDVVSSIRIPKDWGLEIGVLSEIYRNYSLNRICQTDIANSYDHKHQPVSHDNPDAGLSKMSFDIIKAMIRKLATDGHVFSSGLFRTLKTSYYRNALDMIDQYYADAIINGLNLDRHTEEKTVELFEKNIMKAGESFLSNPMETPFLPSWNRVKSAIPDIYQRLTEVVKADNA